MTFARMWLTPLIVLLSVLIISNKPAASARFDNLNERQWQMINYASHECLKPHIEDRVAKNDACMAQVAAMGPSGSYGTIFELRDSVVGHTRCIEAFIRDYAISKGYRVNAAQQQTQGLGQTQGEGQSPQGQAAVVANDSVATNSTEDQELAGFSKFLATATKLSCEGFLPVKDRRAVDELCVAVKALQAASGASENRVKACDLTIEKTKAVIIQLMRDTPWATLTTTNFDEEAFLKRLVGDGTMRVCTVGLIEDVAKKLICEAIFSALSSGVSLIGSAVLTFLDTWLPGPGSYLYFGVKFAFCMRGHIWRGLHAITAPSARVIDLKTRLNITENPVDVLRSDFERYSPVNLTQVMNYMNGLAGSQGMANFIALSSLVPAVAQIPGMSYMFMTWGAYRSTSNVTKATNVTQASWVTRAVSGFLLVISVKNRICTAIWDHAKMTGDAFWRLTGGELINGTRMMDEAFAAEGSFLYRSASKTKHAWNSFFKRDKRLAFEPVRLPVSSWPVPAEAVVRNHFESESEDPSLLLRENNVNER